MKPFSRLLACVAALWASALLAQQPATQPQSSQPHQIGLIDMAEVFKNYEKFTAMTVSLQKEIEQTDDQAKQSVEQIKQFQDQLSSGNLQEGSADFSRIESQMIKANTDLETFKRMAQRDFLRKEADIYKTVYLEVEDAVKRYANYYQYTLILRFNRQSVNEADNPREIINGMNRQVVYFRPQDDITDRILEFLNSEWRKRQGSGAAPTGATPSIPRSTNAPPRGVTR